MGNRYCCYLLVVIGMLSTDSAMAQRQDCVCRAKGSDKAFRLPPTTDCRADCTSKGAFNVQSCQLLTKTDGDCKGHLPCACGIDLALLGEGVGARFIRKNNYKEQTVVVGETVRFLIQGLPRLIGGGGLGDEEDRPWGGNCTLRSSCTINYGDGETGTCDIAAFPPLTHKYLKPNTYVATVEVNTTCERSATSTSCGFTCSSGVIETPIKVVAKKRRSKNSQQNQRH